MGDANKKVLKGMAEVSRWAVTIFFLVILLPVTFYIGTQYQAVIDQITHSQESYPDPRILCDKIKAQEEEALRFKASQEAASTTLAP